MNNKKGVEKKIYSGILTFLLLFGAVVLTITTSYAYFLSKMSIKNPDNAKSNFTTANITATYSDGNAINLTNAIPNTTSKVKTIKFSNTGNVDLAYKINWKTITNTGITGLKYTISCTDTNTTGTGTNLDMPSSPTTLISGTLKPNTANTCELQITYTDTGIDQTGEMGKTFTASLEAVAAVKE